MQQGQIGAIGIDFGSQRSVIAVAKKGGVEVIANEGSHRETQNVIGFGAQERFIGEQGALQSKSNFKNTVSFFNRFLGMTGRPPYFREETKWLSVSNQVNESGKFQFNVNYMGQPQQLFPEQLTATMLNKLKDIINQNQINFGASNSVISVPSYYTESERKALLDACKIAEFPVERLLNETTAIATSYGLFRKSDLDASTPRYVAFVDMGHSKTSAFIGSFTKDKATIVAQVNDRNLGARDLDWTIYEQCCEQFEKESGGLTPKESKKAQLRLFDVIEKQRKVLSANSDAVINIEYLMEDIDFTMHLSREQFNVIVEPVLQRFQQLMDFLAIQAQNLKIKIHSVEVVGGATRIPAIQQILTKRFNVESVSRTLNASESIARGCAMIAATKNPSFRVTEYNIDDANFYPIRVGWLYGTTLNEQLKTKSMDIENTQLTEVFPEKQRPVLFDNNCAIPSLKSFNLTKADPVELTIFYDPAPTGFHAIIQQVRVPAIKPKHPDFFSKIRIRLDQNGLTHLEDVNLNEEFTEEVKVAKEKPKDVPKENEQAKMQDEAPKIEEEFEIQKKKKQIQSKVTCELINYYSSTQQEIQNFFEIESTMINQDKLTHETYRKKNELEAYIYNMRSNLDSTHKDFVTQQDLTIIKNELDVQYEWLYDEGVKSTKGQYSQRLDKIKQLGDPINKRYKDFKDTPDELNHFVSQIAQIEAFAQTQDEKYSHITVEERQKVLQEAQNARVWIQNNLLYISKADKTKTFEINVQTVIQYKNEFIQRTQSIMNRPKPAAPKEEPKPQTQSQEQPNQEQNKQDNAQQQKMETE